MKGNANIFDESQLKTKEIVMAALFQHYGWKMNAAGEYVKGATGRDIPNNTDKVTIKRDDIFVRKWIGTEKVVEFFENNAQNTTSGFNSNFKDASLPEKKFRIFSGIQMLSSAGATGADVADLIFGEVGESEINTGTISLDLNGTTVLKDQSIQGLFLNDDAIPGYFRFPKLEVLEPTAKIEMAIKQKTGAGDFWVDMKLVGWIIE